VAAVDALQGGVAGGLQAEFEPDLRDRLGGKDGQFFGLQAVRPCPQADSGKVGESAQFRDDLPESVHGRIGIGVGLQVGQKKLGVVFFGKFFPPEGVLVRKGDILVRHPGTGAVGVAEDASGAGEGAVPVGAGETGVQGDLLDPNAEAAAQIGRKGVVPVHGGSHSVVVVLDLRAAVQRGSCLDGGLLIDPKRFFLRLNRR